MFNNNTSAANTTSATTIITKGTRFQGNLKSKENIRLDGVVSGEIHCEQRLVIGLAGCAEGTIETQDADISGTIQGDISVLGHLNIQSTAKIFGNIQAMHIQVSEGAIMEGECRVGNIKPKMKEAVKPKIAAKKTTVSLNKTSIKSTTPTPKKVAEKAKISVDSSPKLPANPVREEKTAVATATTKERFFPEGEFGHSIEKKEISTPVIPKKKAVVAKKQVNVTKELAKKVRSTPQFNTDKFSQAEPVPMVAEPVMETEVEVVELEKNAPRRMGIRLPSITMKW